MPYFKTQRSSELTPETIDAVKRVYGAALWIVDLNTSTATHKTGLVIQFVQNEDDPQTWDGVALNDDIWFAEQSRVRPAAELLNELPHMMREAGTLYLEALKRRN